MTTHPPTSQKRKSEHSKEEEVKESGEGEVEVGVEDAGEMACTGGCKGNWSRYSFEELDWNQDPLAEDGIVQCIQCLNWSHERCVRRAAVDSQGPLPDWICGVCGG